MVDGALSVPQVGWRGKTVTAELARDIFRECGFISLAHEKIKWVFDGAFCDCFSLVRKPRMHERHHGMSNETVFYNEKFSEELQGARFVSARYTSALTSD